MLPPIGLQFLKRQLLKFSSITRTWTSVGRLKHKEFTLVHPPICSTLQLTLHLIFSPRYNKPSLKASMLVLILTAILLLVWLPATPMKFLVLSNWKTLQEGLLKTWSMWETHGTKIITVDLGQIVTPDGPLLTKNKFLMLRTPMMDPSSWTQTPSRLPSTITRSITSIPTGITTSMRLSVTMELKNNLISPSHQVKNSSSLLIYMTTECMLLAANPDIPQVLSKFTREQHFWTRLQFPIKSVMVTFITIT